MLATSNRCTDAKSILSDPVGFSFENDPGVVNQPCLDTHRRKLPAEPVVNLRRSNAKSSLQDGRSRITRHPLLAALDAPSREKFHHAAIAATRKTLLALERSEGKQCGKPSWQEGRAKRGEVVARQYPSPSPRCARLSLEGEFCHAAIAATRKTLLAGKGRAKRGEVVARQYPSPSPRCARLSLEGKLCHAAIAATRKTRLAERWSDAFQADQTLESFESCRF